MNSRWLRLLPVIGFVALLGWTLLACATAAGAQVALQSGSQPASGNPADLEPIIIDHTCADLSQIPDYWLEQAKQLAIHYGHTSHGSQINSGIGAIEAVNPGFDYSIFYAVDSPPDGLDCDPGTLCVYDGNPPETYISPDDYWSTENGRERTRAVAGTDLFGFSMWSWCGEQSLNSIETVQLYLDTLALFEQEYPDMRFIYMTGHTDGGSETLERNNNMVRNYVQANGKVLFDFADIESYDPAGTYYPDTDDSCPWCYDWCAAHPDDCTDLPDTCAHSHPLNCMLKGQAFWWMMARLAGWDGLISDPDFSPSAKFPSPRLPIAGDSVTYTVAIRNAGALIQNTVRFTDVVPAGLAYDPGTLTATTGVVTDTDPSILRWAGSLSPTPVVTITYAVSVVTVEPWWIVNTAEILVEPSNSGDPPIYLTRDAWILVNQLRLFLPVAQLD